MTTLPIVTIIILLSTTEITVTDSYCEQKPKHLQTIDHNVKQKCSTCSTDDTTIETSWDLDAF